MKLIITLLATLGLAGVAHADTASSIKGSAGNYGSAGCGLGSLAFGKQQGGIQVIAATLNGTGVQTFGITSGTSNCGEALWAKAEVNTFIESNSVALENDIVRGQGETLSTLNNMLGCGSQFNGTLQQNYKSIYAPGVKASDKIVELAQSCQG